MKNFDELVEKNDYSKKDVFEFCKAKNFSYEFLKSEFRKDGTSFFDRNLKIASYLSDSKMSPEIVIAGLLYGVEDKVSKEKVSEKFGKEVAVLVFEQIILKKVRKKSVLVSADLMRQIFFSSLENVGAIFVKLALKLVSLESLSVFDEKTQKEIAQDALDFYAPLAGRLGAENFKRKIEDAALKIIKPKKYSEIEKFLKESEEDREKYLNNLIREFSSLLEGKFIKIKGRQKHIYSIYKKTIELRKPLKSQRDHMAIRIITNTKKDCYDCLGIIHEKFDAVFGSLKDYISSPKDNGYQSIHTAVKLKDSKILEVQIRTIEMDENAEEGAAAHWAYKKIKGDISFEKKTAWAKEIVGLRDLNKEFLNSLKVDLFSDKIYCYTPKGDAFSLPTGSTVLDFAYRIHGRIGDTATGARVNGSFVSLKNKLSSGDIVEVITSKFQRPRRDWLKFVVTSRAKSYIKKGVKKFDGFVVKAYPKIQKKDIGFDNLVFSKDFHNHKCSFAQCCNPLPQDEIIGVLKSFKKILVHKKDCSKLSGSVKSQVNVEWQKTFSCPIKIKIKVKDRSGVLSDILNTVASGGFVIKEANMKLIDNNFAECFLVVVPRAIDEVERLVNRIKNIRSVVKVYFE